MQKFISPLDESLISHLAQDETGKRQYYRPIYSIHKWWARRPGSLFRAILLATQSRGKAILDQTVDGSISPLSDYFQNHDLDSVVVFDPFMGGGTIVAEANRLGAKVVGCDINPVSFWIVRETIKPIDIKKLHVYFLQLQESAGNEIRKLYQTVCPRCDKEVDTLYAFWIRTVRCPVCNQEIFLYKRTLLNEGERRNKQISAANPATVFCPKCFSLNLWDGTNRCSCQSCGENFDPRQGTYNQGIVSCVSCHKRMPLVDLTRQGQALTEQLVALEYLCEDCGGRLYKNPDQSDLRTIQLCQQTFEVQKDRLIYPKEPILQGDSSVRWRSHNYKYYYQVFSPRQLLSFNLIIKAILDIPEEEYQQAFFTIFSNALEYNNMMTPYNYPHRKLHHLFNYHALPLTTTPVENCVWGIEKEGAGTFVNCYYRYTKAKEYCINPFERYKDSSGKVRTVYTTRERIDARLVKSFEELQKTKRSAWLLCKDSSSLPEIPDKSIDFVITDPPYLDSIHYSELSNFFYVWLKAIVNGELFSLEHVPIEKEVIVNRGMKKDEKDYQEFLTAILKECKRVLKDEGKLIFTFHHTRLRGWWIVLQAIRNSGFRVWDAFSVQSEYRVNPHIRDKNALDMDLVLVCQKQEVPFIPLSAEPKQILERAIGNLSPSLSDNHLFLNFMGEVLRTASVNESISYKWFEQVFSYFDNFKSDLYTINQFEKVEYSQKKFVQLTLMEGSAIDDQPQGPSAADNNENSSTLPTESISC